MNTIKISIITIILLHFTQNVKSQVLDSEFGTNGEILLGLGPEFKSSWHIPLLMRGTDEIFAIFNNMDALKIVSFNEQGDISNNFGIEGTLEVPFNYSSLWPHTFNRSQTNIYDSQMLAWRYSCDNNVDNIFSEMEVLLLNESTGNIESTFGNNGRISIEFPELDRDSLLGYGLNTSTKTNDFYWFSFQVNYFSSYLVRISTNGDNFDIWNTYGEGGHNELDLLGPEYTDERISRVTSVQGGFCTIATGTDSNSQPHSFLLTLNEDLTMLPLLGGTGKIEVSNSLDALGNNMAFPLDFIVNNNKVYFTSNAGQSQISVNSGEVNEDWSSNVANSGFIDELTFNPIFDANDRVYSPGYFVFPGQLKRLESDGDLDLSFANNGIWLNITGPSSQYVNVLDVIAEGNSIFLLIYGDNEPQTYSRVYVLKFILDELSIDEEYIKTSVYPNPTKQDWKVAGKWKKYIITNNLGKEIIRGEISNDGTIRANELSSGVYQLLLINDNEKSVVKVIKH
jgi:hypothetical protein